MHLRSLTLFLGILIPAHAQAFLGTELGPLLQLVAGQVREIEQLTEQVGIARDQMKAIKELNDGIERTVTQIRTLREVLERVQGLNPKSVRSLADLNDLMVRAKGSQKMLEDLLVLKVDVAEQAIGRTALQADTAYRMGQEMAVTGSQLARESETASPGRATQISAAAQSAQMLSQGVQLQTLAQVAELQALLVEFHKAQIQKQVEEERSRRSLMERQLTTSRRRPS